MIKMERSNENMIEKNDIDMKILMTVECALHNKVKQGEEAKENLLTLYRQKSISSFREQNIKEAMICISYIEYNEQLPILSKEEIKKQIGLAWNEKGHKDMEEYVMNAIANRTDISTYFNKHPEDRLDKAYCKIKSK